MNKKQVVRTASACAVVIAMALGIVALQLPMSASHAGQENRIEKCIARCEARYEERLDFCAELAALITIPVTEDSTAILTTCEGKAEVAFTKCLIDRCGVAPVQ